MHLTSIHGSPLSIAFKTSFKHASAERSSTEALWVEARTRTGLIGFGEGCPREYVSAENMTTACAFVDAHRDDWLARITDEHALKDWVVANRSVIDSNPAAWTAVELALLDLLGKERKCSMDALLGLEILAGRFHYTAVLGDASPGIFRLQLERYLKLGFVKFKIKLSGNPDRDTAKVRALAECGVAGQRVRADANNLWQDPDAAAAHINALRFRFFALEEPLRCADYAGLAELARRLEARIILDESFLREEQLDQFSDLGNCWIVNLRISKMGGLLRSLNMLKPLRERGVGLIIGAHVGETSVLTRAALTVANCARDVLVAQEGAFGTHLLETDVAQPPLMFGSGGVIDIGAFGISEKPGLGLEVSSRQAA
jgi:L-alanine-DL-glutamate epimerase-like enolase superfamily enzyme